MSQTDPLGQTNKKEFYEFIVSNMRFSFSSASSYETCALGFQMGYLDAIPRVNNFFAEFGTLVHMCMEEFFMGKREVYELSQFYLDNYSSVVKTLPPPIPLGMAEKYKQQGLDFLNNFSFELEDYEVLGVEDTLEFNFRGFDFTARPDLVLKHKKSGKVTLWDYKTSAPFRIDSRTGREIVDKKKMASYYKQMYIYTHSLMVCKGIQVDEITLLFPRLQKEVTIPWVKEEEEEALNWLEETLKSIKEAGFFPGNNDEKYFCNNICGVRIFCPFSK